MDRVSNLPDEVLCHILVLALQCNSPLKKFSLECATGADSERVDGWINSVLARGVSDLDLAITIDCDEEDNYQLSPKCFECSTLVKLKINFGIDLTLVAGRVFLPLLKTLVLDTLLFCPNEFEILLQALPSLEELVLTHIMWKARDVTVSNTPSLLHFECSGYVASDYPLVNMGNLVDAQIDFLLTQLHIKQLREPDLDWFDDQVVLPFSNRWNRGLVIRNVWNFFHGLRNARNLDLFPDTLEVLSMCSESMPVFNNLNSLTIRSDEVRGWQAMPALLSNCPHLETLVIKGLVHHVTDKCGDACCCISREDKGLSLTVCPVKEMKIHGFQGTMEEMAMIKHFLDYFPCLKEMEVYAEENNNPTQLGNHEVPKHVLEMFQLYNKLSSCNVQLCI
ncbi:hypothetical protein BRARA_G01821 [Brassica rapa]|uniref:FBD domain-containing protein n=1 Tax=Brassica campestris TaxID=3711 RepID=A0A397YM62_BRACM|nr:hypothetical protein BRARA_G01821 [Brassica rapa]